VRSSDQPADATPAQRHERDVVLLLHAGPGERVQLVEEAVQQGASGVIGGHRLAQPREAVHLPAGTVLLDETVGVEEHPLAGANLALGLLVDDPGHEAERQPGRTELDDAVGRAHIGQVVAGVCEHEAARGRLEDAVQAGDEHPRRHLRRQELVRTGEDQAGLDEARRLRPEDRVRSGHDEGRRDALVGDVADDDTDAALAKVDEVVEVAAHHPCRAVVGGDLPLRQVRKLARQELLLDQLRDLELLLVALAFGGLGGLLADELRHADRGCRLGGERREEAAVVGGVVLLGKARAQVQRTDELALGDERHDERDARGPQILQRRGGELEAGQVHGSGRRLEIGEQRVCLRDVDGDAGLLDGCGRRDWRGDGCRVRRGPADEAADRARDWSHRGHPPGRTFGHRYGTRAELSPRALRSQTAVPEGRTASCATRAISSSRLPRST
jgi:hypothetical protein